MRRILLLGAVLVLAGASPSQGDQAEPNKEDKLLSGMSVVGNDEAPKSLVIVPWKSSELGDTLDISRILDDELRPVDREVFARELHYYEIRAASTAGRQPAGY